MKMKAIEKTIDREKMPRLEAF